MLGSTKIRSNLHTDQYAGSVPSDHSQGQALVEPLSLPGVARHQQVSLRGLRSQERRREFHISAFSQVGNTGALQFTFTMYVEKLCGTCDTPFN